MRYARLDCGRTIWIIMLDTAHESTSLVLHPLALLARRRVFFLTFSNDATFFAKGENFRHSSLKVMTLKGQRV